LLTVTNYKGYYPEVNGSGQGTNNQATNAGSSSSLMSLGIDKGTYPAAKTFTAGVNIQF
jgi:TonB-dependent starch-binding outer membrane protein SusC